MYFLWFADGGPITSSNRHKQFKNGTLKISNVKQARDDGRYTCVVSAKHGKSDSGHIWLTVLGKLIVKCNTST